MKEKEFLEFQIDPETEAVLTDPIRLKEQRKRVVATGHEPSEAKMLGEKGMYDEDEK